MSTTPRRIFIVAGEASGDAHAAALLSALRDLDPTVLVEGLGGRRMEAAACAVRERLADKAVMGFRDVLANLGYFRRLLDDTAAHLERTRPDLLVLVDYPGFNLRLAARARAAGIKVLFYISPQVWAWKRGRVRTIARVVDRMLVIFPFEEQLYAAQGLDTRFVGHPLVDELGADAGDPALRRRLLSAWTIGLLPGSRVREVERNLPDMVLAWRRLREERPELRAAVAVPSSVAPVVWSVLGRMDEAGIEVLVDAAHQLMAGCRMALVCSGTATLECAWYGAPLCVLYRLPPLSWALGRLLVRTPDIALVNIVAGRRVAPEVVGWREPVERMVEAARLLLPDGPERTACVAALKEVRSALGEPGASRRAAEQVLDMLGVGAAEPNPAAVGSQA